MAPARHDRALDWRAAVVLGLLTSTFSTIAISLGSARVGRDVTVDWMIVGTVLLRDAGLQAEPGWRELGAGILVHLSADFFWAVVFFGLFGRWTSRLGPWALLRLAPAWAFLTSATEYFLVLPWLQPLFVMQQPYWPGLATHLVASSLYPLYPSLRDRLARRPSRWAGFVVLAVVAAFAARDREVPWAALLGAGDQAFDQRFLRRMAAHHELGVRLAREAAARASNPELHSLARLMVADQSGELAIVARWWRSWFAAPLPPPTPAEHAAMPGMPAPEELARLAAAAGGPFDQGFVAVMSRHHAGAVAMAEEAAMTRAADPRVRLLAQSIAHAQRNQIVVMRELAAGRGAEGPLPPGETPTSHERHLNRYLKLIEVIEVRARAVNA